MSMILPSWTCRRSVGMLPGSLAELTTWQYFSAAPSTASQCAPHWQPLSACILVRLCTHIHHIYVNHDTEYGIKRIGACCPSELSHVSGAEYHTGHSISSAYLQWCSDGKCSRQHVRLCRQQENICLQYSTDFDMKRIGACCPSQLSRWPEL